MMKKVIALRYNWFYTPEGDVWDDVKVGKTLGSDLEVISITESECHGQGDRHWFDVNYSDGTMMRIFNPCMAFYE